MAKGCHNEANDIFELTKSGKSPYLIAEMAKSIGRPPLSLSTLILMDAWFGRIVTEKKKGSG